MSQQSQRYITIGRVIALISFLIGTLIFITYYFTSNSDFAFLGYGFVVFAGIVNLILFIKIILLSFSDRPNQRKLLKTAGIMLLNIPIMLVFVWFSMVLISTMRITFTNEIGHHLTDIKILGCETKYIPELKPNQSKTVWVGIPNDCSLTLEYVENGELTSETIAGYVTTGMGHKMKHRIDGEDKDIL